MNNQKGEVVTGIIIVMMAGMMIFGMLFMHGNHGDCRERTTCGQHSDGQEKRIETLRLDHADESGPKKTGQDVN
jgi:hypothetical protein